MIKLRIVILAGMALLLLLPLDSFACSCGGTSTPYSFFQGAAAVFIGKAIAVTDAAGKEVPEGRLPTLQRDPLAERYEGDLYYRFLIQERFKGPDIEEVTVRTSINMCQFGFGKGGEWLVYAYPNNADTKAPFAADIFCDRTRPWPDSEDDVHFLRGLFRGEPEPRIYGSVQLMEAGTAGDYRYSFLSGVTIVATSGRKRFTAVTDKNGFYRFDKLPNGKYKVAPILPAEYELDPFYVEQITLTDGSPNDQFLDSDLDVRTFVGRNAYSELVVNLKKRSPPERK